MDVQTDCPVCYESLRTNTPTCLACQHVFCTGCVKRIMLRGDEGFQVSCPSCRKLTYYDSDEPPQFHFLVGLLQSTISDASSSSSSSSAPILFPVVNNPLPSKLHDCSHCKAMETIYCCQTCWRSTDASARGLFCSDCCVLAHSGHDFIPLRGMVDQGVKQVDALRQAHKNLITSLQSCRLIYPIAELYAKTNDDLYKKIDERITMLSSQWRCCRNELNKFEKMTSKKEGTSKLVESFNTLEFLLEQGNNLLQHAKQIIAVFQSFLQRVTTDRQNYEAKFSQMISEFERNQRSPNKRTYQQSSLDSSSGASSSRRLRFDADEVFIPIPPLNYVPSPIGSRSSPGR